MRLTPHFTFAELTRSAKADALGIDNTPPPELLPRLVLLAELLERIRAAAAYPVTVTSGYRCQKLNDAVGKRKTSDHIHGHAADIVAPGFGTPPELARLLVPLVDALGIGQLILEEITQTDGRKKRWVHVSTHRPERPINRIITINDAGILPGIVGTT